MVLKGLSKVTHLINIEMVEDLIPIMKTILLRQPAAPLMVKLLCIHCVLSTILGPGQELQVDDDIFLSELKLLLTEINVSNFNHWNVLLETIEIALLKRRETRYIYIDGFIKLLFLHSCHLPSIVSVTILSLIHSLLLRYPKSRYNINILSVSLMNGNNKDSTNGNQDNNQQDDEVADNAMQVLRNNESLLTIEELNHEKDFDGSLIVNLFRHSLDKKYHRIIQALTSQDIIPITYRLIDSQTVTMDSISSSLLFSFNDLDPKLYKKTTIISNKTKHKNQKSDKKGIVNVPSNVVTSISKNRLNESSIFSNSVNSEVIKFDKSLIGKQLQNYFQNSRITSK